MATPTLEWARRYDKLGLAVVPALFQSKECRHTGWQSQRLAPEDFPTHFSGQENIAGVFGAMSDGIVCVDCDWPEAVPLARELLPRTVTYGRESSTYSHFLVRSSCKTRTYKSAVDGRPVVEILGDGHLCLLPGSVHPSGEDVRFEEGLAPDDVDVAEVGDLLTAVGRIAGGALLLLVWPLLTGSRHELVLALTGACLHSNWPRDDVLRFFAVLLQHVEDDERGDRIKAVQTTVERHAAGDTVTGWPRAAELLGTAASEIEKWLGVNQPVLNIAAPTEWPELIPFDDMDVNYAPYPMEGLGALQDVVRTAAHVQQVPEALAANCALAAVAVAVQGLYDVVTPNQRYPLSLFLLTIAETGERKSTTDSLLFSAHSRWQRHIQKQLSGEKDLRMPGLFFESGTMEGLRRMLAQHWPSVIAVNADAADFLAGHSMREGRDASTGAFLSKLWEGQLRGHMRGQDDAPIDFHGRRLSVSWMVQPNHAGSLVNDAMSTQGLLSRFLIAYPKTRIGQREYVVPTDIDKASLDRFERHITTLMETQLDMDAEHGVITTTALPIDGAAVDRLIQLDAHYEKSLGDGGVNAPIRALANKATQHLCRLAGVIVAFEGRRCVTAEDLDRGQLLLDYYLEEWRSLALRAGNADPGVQQARRLLQWLRGYTKRHPGPFKFKPIYTNGLREFRGDSDRAKKPFNELIRRGYVRARGNTYELRPEDAE